MRQISSAGLTKLATKLGTEPIIIVEIDWGRDGNPSSYADKDVGVIPGKILELGSLDNVINVQNSSNSQSITLSLDDTDASLKAIIDTQDIHEVPVRVYQYFTGLDLTDKFLVFAGRVNSPIRWSEADRTLSFSVVSQIEDLEFGFSAEEGQIIGLPADMIGKPWPVVFGTCLDVPALQVTRSVSGSTLCGVGVLSGVANHLAAPLGNSDCSFGQSISVAFAQISFLQVVRAAYLSTGFGTDNEKAAQLLEQINSIQSQITLQLGVRNAQIDCAEANRQQTVDDAQADGVGCNPVRIIGGEDFPQGQTLTLNINGGLFTGTMSGQDFTITSRSHPKSETAVEQNEARLTAARCSQPTPMQEWDWELPVPPGKGDFLNGNRVRRRGFVICNTTTTSVPNIDRVLEHFYAPAGARVTIEDGETITYVASITPGTVLDVKAFKQFEGERRLVSVPSSYYTVTTQNFGAFTATLILFSGSLSARTGEGWGDDIYVTFQSSIGPNTAEIVEWIVDNYTDLTVDATSFAAVETLVDPFPSNFAVLDRRNTLGLLKDIAFQARCALWVNNGVVFMKYLPIEPASDLTITISDIELGTVETSMIDTEDLVTKLVAEYTISYAETEPNKIIVRNNVSKYGTKEDTFDWFIYNGADIVYHAATFWAIRLSTSWKKISFKGFLPLLRLETFDTVTLNLPGYVASGAVKAVVEKATYDSDSHSVAVECLVPVASGTMTQHPLFWPAETLTPYPTPYDIPGGSGSGATVIGTLNTGDTSHLYLGNGVFVGGINAIANGKTDRGKVNLNDSAFTAGEVVIASGYAGAAPEAEPTLDLGIDWLPPAPAFKVSQNVEGSLYIDIRTTQIFDSDNPFTQSTLDSIIRGISSGDLVLSTTAKLGDGSNESTFDYKYDGTSGKFGAGTAFLKD